MTDLFQSLIVWLGGQTDPKSLQPETDAFNKTDQPVTQLSERDREIFAAMLDDESSKPNDTLMKAAKLYRKQVG